MHDDIESCLKDPIIYFFDGRYPTRYKTDIAGCLNGTNC